MCDLIRLHLPVTEALTADVPGDQPHALHGPGVRVSANLRILQISNKPKLKFQVPIKF